MPPSLGECCIEGPRRLASRRRPRVFCFFRLVVGRGGRAASRVRFAAHRAADARALARICRTGAILFALRGPCWLAICRVFYHARQAWAQHHVRPPAAQRRILDRDGWRCAAPECTQHRNLQVHHVEYRSRGGNDDDDNRVTLCAFHHQIGEHGGLMRVRGKVQSDGNGLTWEMGLDEHGRPLRVYRNEVILARSTSA